MLAGGCAVGAGMTGGAVLTPGSFQLNAESFHDHGLKVVNGVFTQFRLAVINDEPALIIPF